MQLAEALAVLAAVLAKQIDDLHRPLVADALQDFPCAAGLSRLH
jgi:hypothetical protein